MTAIATVLRRGPTQESIDPILTALSKLGQFANRAPVKHVRFGLLTSITGGLSAGGGLCGIFQKMKEHLEGGRAIDADKRNVQTELRRFLEWDI